MFFYKWQSFSPCSTRIERVVDILFHAIAVYRLIRLYATIKIKIVIL
jgi:hypothetical protein